MTSNSGSTVDKPMLGGCCVCLDERGWAENPLVYCDGNGCSIAVHQACYGIVTVPSGPWYCRRCEVHKTSVKLQCVLCPLQDGAMKMTDSQQWAHVVCALYIPEVEFGNVSTMEPIVLQKIPAERYDKICYVCDEKNQSGKSAGACMDCAKVGCKLSFHVTCAQMSGLLCEEAGGSNTTKYCGYCSQHFSKHKKINPFKSLACSRVYKLPSSSSESTSPDKSVDQTADNFQNVVPRVNSPDEKAIPATEDANKTKTVVNDEILVKQENPEPQEYPSETAPQISSLDTGSTLATLAEFASRAIEMETEIKPTETKTDVQKLPQPLPQDDVNAAPKKKRKNKNHDREFGSKKNPKSKKNKVDNVPLLHEKSEIIHPMSNVLEDAGYAMAPKHSVVTLSSFGEDSLAPSHPTDIGGTKPEPTTRQNVQDGLTAIEHLIDQQKGDMMKFFQEFGTPQNVSSMVQMLHHAREENSQLENSVEKMTHRRDQLLAIKARLSVPLKSTQFPHVGANQEASIPDSKQFTASTHGQQYAPTYPYFVNKH